MLMKDNGYYVGFIGKYGVGNYLPQKSLIIGGACGTRNILSKDKDGNPASDGLISEQIDEFWLIGMKRSPLSVSEF